MLKNGDKALPARRSRALVCGLSLALLAAPVWAHSEKPALTSQTESFLGNRSSVGALVGGILAGAAFATPLAPLGGTVVGFFVGKSTDLSKENDAASSYQRRSFVPTESVTFDGPQLALSDQSEGLGIADEQLAEENPPEKKESDSKPAKNKTAEDSLEGVSRSSDESEDAVVPPSAKADVELASEDELSAAGQPEKPAPEPVNLVITKEVGLTQEKLDVYADIIRKEQGREAFEPNPQCPGTEVPKYRKKLAVAGFPMANPEQSVFGGLDDAETVVSRSLYRRLEDSDRVQAFSAPKLQMVASRAMAPSVRMGSGNQLKKYSAVSRELGAQFVVSGVIRDIGINSPDTWDTDYSSKMKRALFGGDASRNFELDVIVHDGYTGRVVMEKHYSGSGRWDASRTDRTGFGSPRFFETDYGKSVAEVMETMTSDVLAQLDCQPMIVPIIEVTGKDLLLDVGTPSGLLPGAKMRLVRAEGSLARPDEPAQLWDTDVELHIHSLSLDSARAWMPKLGSHINIQEGDYAVIY